MIAADQNSWAQDGATLDAVDGPSCDRCHFYNALDGRCKADHPTLCTNSAREDGRSIIWIARKPVENPATIVFDDPAYASLGRVLTRAHAQAATGKGAERHGQGQPFERQPMQDLIRLHGVGFATGQASKKAQEALRLPRARAVAELLGAINYLAGAVIAIEAGDTHHKD
jgi:hypothetical protein